MGTASVPKRNTGSELTVRNERYSHQVLGEAPALRLDQWICSKGYTSIEKAFDARPNVGFNSIV